MKPFLLFTIIALTLRYFVFKPDNEISLPILSEYTSQTYAKVINSDFVSPLPKTEITPRQQAPTPFEKQSRNIVEYLASGNHEEIENIITEAVNNNYVNRDGFHYATIVLESPFYEYVSYLDQGWLNSLNAWVNKSPDSSYAYTTRAIFYHEYGWKIRGYSFANKVPRDAMKEYKEYMQLSFQDLEKALELDPNNPIALKYMLNLSIDLSLSPEQFDRYFKKANQDFSYFIQTYRVKTDYLNPKWHGSEEDLLKFAKQTVNQAPRNTPIPVILIEAHEGLCYRYPSKQVYLNKPEVWRDIEESFQKLLEDYPETGVYLAWYSQVAQDAGREDLSLEYGQKAWNLDPNHPYVRNRAANLGLIQ